MDTCHQCGNGYENIGMHWSKSSCEYPNFTNQEEEIITGLLMGDGSVVRCGGCNPRLSVGMIMPNYLKYLDNIFGILGNGVSLKESAKQSANESKRRGFSSIATEENYSDVYEWRTMNHPQLEKYRQWYSNGKKVWPEDIKLTPTVLKHWFCGDGSRIDNGNSEHISIAMSNEVDNLEKVETILQQSNLPKPSNWNIHKRKTGGKICEAVFSVSQSYELWEYMGEPLPDFEYKWPEEYR